MDETPGQDGTGAAPLPPGALGVVIVDHGSRRQDANRRHEDFVRAWAARSAHPVVEAAHMELAEPSIGTAFDACVAARHPGVHYLVSAPLGPHPLLMDIVDQRIAYCIAHVAGDVPECDACAGTG